MKISELKRYIYENEKIPFILAQLNFHSIKSYNNKKYYTCGFKDGNNKKALTIYNNEFLNIKSYTRTIINSNGFSPSLIDVVCFVKDLYISYTVKWLSEILDLNYYDNLYENIPPSVEWIDIMSDMEIKEKEDVEKPLKPIPEKILKYYFPYVNDVFFKDGITYKVQRLFEIGYDLYSNRYTIPIRDELGTLVGVKGRCFSKEVPKNEEKYIYIIPCAKTHILYGLYITYNYIKAKNEVIVVESEKSVLRLFSLGIFNTIAIGGHDLSKSQIIKLQALNVSEIVLCYDEDVYRLDNGKVSKRLYVEEINKFIVQQKVSIMVDIYGDILNKKESPADDIDKFKIMYNKRIIIKKNKEKT